MNHELSQIIICRLRGDACGLVESNQNTDVMACPVRDGTKILVMKTQKETIDG